MSYQADMGRNPALEQAAAVLYDTRLPYHNFSHIMTALGNAHELIDHCREADLSVEPGVIYPALLFHDAGYHEPARGHESKEAHSAALAARVLGDYGIPAARIEAICRAILATRCGADCDTLEARIVRAADLAGLAASYRLFLQNALRLWREDILLRGRDLAWEDWRDEAAAMLERFLAVDLGVSPACYAADGEAWLNKHGRENLARLYRQPDPDSAPC